MTENSEEVYSCECAKCGYRWKIPASEWLIFNLATGKIPHCPKCHGGRIFHKIERA